MTPMRRGIAVILLAVLIVAVAAPPAQACLECVALGLASFAVFTQLVSAIATPRVVYTVPAYSVPAYCVTLRRPWPAPYYPVSYAVSYPAASSVPSAAPRRLDGRRVVQYPHGRYELRGDGVSVPWAWVWVPALAMPAVAPAGPVRTAPRAAEGPGLPDRRASGAGLARPPATRADSRAGPRQTDWRCARPPG